MNRIFKKLIFFLFALGLSGAAAHAQSYGLLPNCELQTAQGQAVAGANAYLLTQPANTSNLTPQATIYSSTTGGALSQPVKTDGFGGCTMYAAQGLYTVVYISPQTGTRIFPDQAIILPSGGSGFIVNPITGIQWPIASGTSLPSNLCPTSATGNLTSGSPTILGVSSFSNVLIGQQVTGTGIPSGTYVQSINTSAGSITLTQNATTTQTGVSLGFFSIGQPFQDTTNNAEYFCSLSGWTAPVQQLIPGANVELSPSDGLGIVTVTALAQAVPPTGSLQYDNDGVFGAANADWNNITSSGFTFGLTGQVGVSGFSCNGTNCTLTSNNIFYAGQSILTTGFTSGAACMDNVATTVLSTGLSPTQFEIAQSATTCSGSFTGDGGLVQEAQVGFTVNGDVTTGINLNTSGTPIFGQFGQINLTTNLSGSGGYGSGDINLSTGQQSGFEQGSGINLTTNTSGILSGDIQISASGTSGGGLNVGISTDMTGTSSNESAASFGVSLTSTNTALGAADANVSFDQNSKDAGANFNISLSNTNHPALGGYSGSFIVSAAGVGAEGGDILLSADNSTSSGDGMIDLTATGPLEWSAENTSLDSDGDLNLQGFITVKAGILPGLIYSAAGTPLPTCASGNNGLTLVVSDATSPTFLGAYASGGSEVAPVVCQSSTGWVTY